MKGSRSATLKAAIAQSPLVSSRVPHQDLALASLSNYRKVLLALLGHPNIASKATVIRTYDHEVQGGTVIKPLTGLLDDGPSDGCVFKAACYPRNQGGSAGEWN